MQLLGTLLGVLVAIGIVLGLFVSANRFADLATGQYRWFCGIGGAIIGAVVGALANSGGWFGGGPLWALGGAVVGAAVGTFVFGVRPPSTDRRRRISDGLRPAIFLGPALAVLGVMLVVPTVRTVYLSFRGKRGRELVGFDNFRSIFRDRDIFTLDGVGNIVTSRLFIAGMVVAVLGVGISAWRAVSRRQGFELGAPSPSISLSAAGVLVVLAAVGSLRGVIIWNNIYWVVLVTAGSTVIGLAIAVLADRARGESLAKSLIFLPMAISFVGASVIWRFVYAFTPAGRDQIGLLNALWVGAGGEPQAWIQQRPWNTLFLVAIMVWIQTGFAMVVLSAAIKAVPTELNEAARVDGANDAQIFWRVTLPQIRTTVAVVVTTLIITVLKVYDIVKVMTNGEFGTDVIANKMFDESFINRDFGRGSALAVLLFLSVVPLMVINVRRSKQAQS